MIPESAPAYVHDLLDALLDQVPIDFSGHAVPADVQERILHRSRRPAPAGPEERLTPREVDVLRCMAAGLSNRSIGNKLHITPSSVNHTARVLFRKLGATDRAHSVATGFRIGILG